MIDLPDASTLPRSFAAGPESWGEAWSNAAATTSETMRVVENTTATVNATYDAYSNYIDEVEKATGVKLHNPMDVDLRQGTWDAKPNPQYTNMTGTEWRDQRIQASLDAFNQQRAAMAAKYPAQAQLIQLDIDGRVKRTMQEAEKKNAEAMSSPALGTMGKLTAGLAGGLFGSARDPVQFVMLAAGAPEIGVGKTVLGRLGRAILTEGLLNGGQEAVLQAASQERKANAGLDHGMADALANVGVAATFGALFGGSIQGGKEFARVFKMGEGGAERAARVIDGNPQPGDIEAVAAALNVDIAPHEATIARGFDERVMDDYALPRDATPDQARVYEAAAKYADDPDNHPPPDLVERMIADEQAGPARTLTADDYERIYGGDQTAIDEATTKLADLQKQVDELTFKTEKGSQYTVSGNTTTRNKALRDAPGHEGDFGLKPQSARTIYLDQNSGALSAAGLQGLDEKGARVAIKDGRATLVTWNRAQNGWGASEGSRNIPFFDEPALGRYPLELWNQASDLPGYEAYSRMHAGNKIVEMSPRVAEVPEAVIVDRAKAAEPLTPQAEVAAAAAAGDIVEPPRDKNGNPENYLDFIGVENADGTFSTMSAAEALRLADEPNFLADLMEACKL